MSAEKHPLAAGAGSPGLRENSAAMSLFPALLEDLSKLVEEPKTANSKIASGVQPKAITRATVSMMSSSVPLVKGKAPARAEEETASLVLPASPARPERTPSVPVVPFVSIPSLLPKEDDANPKFSMAIPSAPTPEGATTSLTARFETKDEPLSDARGSEQSRDRVSPLASKGADAGNRAKPRGHGTSPIPEFSAEVAPVAESALTPAKPQAGPVAPALAGQAAQNQTVPMASSPAVAPGAPVQEAHFTRTIGPEEKVQGHSPAGGQMTQNRTVPVVVPIVVPAASSLAVENTIATGQGVQEQEPEPWFSTLPADVPVSASVPMAAVPRPATRPIQSRAALATLPMPGKAAPPPAAFSVVAATEGSPEAPVPVTDVVQEAVPVASRREAAAESPAPTEGVAPRAIETTHVSHPSAPAKVLAFSGTLVREPDSGDDRKIQTTEPVKPHVTVDRPALPVAVVRDVESGDRQPQPVAAPAPEPDPVRIPVVSGSDTGRPSAREGKSAAPAKPKVAVAGERIRPEEPVDLEPVFMPDVRTSVASPVQTPAAPPAPLFAATRPEPQAIAAPELVIPELPKTSITPLGARDIRLDLNNGGQHVAVRVADAGGKVSIAVHTSDSSLAGTLRDDLPSLSTRLEETGLKAESWQTGAPPAPASARAVEPVPIHSIDRPEGAAWTRVESTATNPSANGAANHPATPWHAGTIPLRRDLETASGGNGRDLPGGGGQKQHDRESHSERNQQQQSNRKQKGNPFAWFMSSVR